MTPEPAIQIRIVNETGAPALTQICDAAGHPLHFVYALAIDPFTGRGGRITAQMTCIVDHIDLRAEWSRDAFEAMRARCRWYRQQLDATEAELDRMAALAAVPEGSAV